MQDEALTDALLQQTAAEAGKAGRHHMMPKGLQGLSCKSPQHQPYAALSSAQALARPEPAHCQLTARWGLNMPTPAGLGMPGPPAAAVCRPADTTAPLPAAARTDPGLAAGVACLYVTTHALPLISRLQGDKVNFCRWPQHLQGTKVQTGRALKQSSHAEPCNGACSQLRLHCEPGRAWACTVQHSDAPCTPQTAFAGALDEMRSNNHCPNPQKATVASLLVPLGRHHGRRSLQNACHGDKPVH